MTGLRPRGRLYASRTMDAQQALADLTEISSQIEAAVVFDDGGKVAASTLAEAGASGGLAESAKRLLAAAEDVRTGTSALTQLEVATGEGSVFVVRDGTTLIAATTGGNPTAGLVFYDLKSALRALKSAAPAKKPAARKKTATAAKKKTGTAGAKKKAAANARKRATRKKPDAS